MLERSELKTLQAMARAVVANKDSAGVALFSGLTPEDKQQFWGQLSESMRKKLVSTGALSAEALKLVDVKPEDVTEFRQSAFAAMTPELRDAKLAAKARWQAMNAQERAEHMDKLGVAYRG
jgi:hypothetical protein